MWLLLEQIELWVRHSIWKREEAGGNVTVETTQRKPGSREGRRLAACVLIVKQELDKL